MAQWRYRIYLQCRICRRCKLNPWVEKIPWRRKWQPIFLPGKCHGERSLAGSTGGGISNPLQHSCLENPHGQKNLVGYSPWDHKESDTTEHTHTHKYGYKHLPQNIIMRTKWDKYIVKPYIYGRLIKYKCSLSLAEMEDLAVMCGPLKHFQSDVTDLRHGNM